MCEQVLRVRALLKQDVWTSMDVRKWMWACAGVFSTGTGGVSMPARPFLPARTEARWGMGGTGVGEGRLPLTLKGRF
jgi:hypothetical protein